MIIEVVCEYKEKFVLNAPNELHKNLTLLRIVISLFVIKDVINEISKENLNFTLID